MFTYCGGSDGPSLRVRQTGFHEAEEGIPLATRPVLARETGFLLALLGTALLHTLG